MKIGLIDVDGHNFPNLPLMKLSAWHKKNGDSVEWYIPIMAFNGKTFDRVYMSKVFTFTPDYQFFVNADEIIKGGTGYFYPDGGEALPEEVEHCYPDYDLYGITEIAYGFLTRGCPRNCDFCVVGKKEGMKTKKVADLREFWDGQKNIVLMDPNIIACPEWKDLFGQLIESRANIDISQGLDIRLMTEEKAMMLKQIKVKYIHFAFDRYQDKEMIIPKFKMFKDITQWDYRKMIVYVLVNFNTTLEQDLERIYLLRDLGYSPYVMIYDKDKTSSKSQVRRLQRYFNSNRIFRTVKSFDEYLTR